MAKFIDTHSAEMIIRSHRSKDAKIKALHRQSVYDENDIHSGYAIMKMIIAFFGAMIGAFITMYFYPITK